MTRSNATQYLAIIGACIVIAALGYRFGNVAVTIVFASGAALFAGWAWGDWRRGR